MTRHEVSQLAIGSKVIVETGIYKGVIGSIKAVDLSASFPNGALLVSTEKHGDIRCSGVEVNRASTEREAKEPVADDEDDSDYVEADGPDSEEDFGEELED